jgi:hypothetical protein
MNKKRNLHAGAPLRALFAVLALASLPGSVLAQTPPPVNDQLKELRTKFEISKKLPSTNPKPPETTR